MGKIFVGGTSIRRSKKCANGIPSRHVRGTSPPPTLASSLFPASLHGRKVVV
jgi:hypothetical protein